MSVRPVLLLSEDSANGGHTQAFTVEQPMDEDILSDVVPSNIVSRQVRLFSPFHPTAGADILSQPSQGPDGESEYDVDEPMEEDQLESEVEVCLTHGPPDPFFV